MKKVYLYDNESDDLVKSKDQNFKLKDGYVWINNNLFYIILSYVVYYLVLIISFIYLKIIKRIKYIGKDKLKGKGYFIYSNHVLTLGDVLNPFLINFPRRPYIICSPSNLGIPFIGKILPIAGALPIPDKIHDQKKLMDSIKKRCENHPVVIYPEAHLWPYYTKIRNFNSSSFHYPVINKKDVYVSVTTFQNKRIIIYIDGPYKMDNNKTSRENIKYLREIVYDKMVELSKKSNYERIKYMKKGFTLVELIAVIAILAILAVVTTPIINNTINKGRDKLSDVQKEQIVKAGEAYFTDNMDMLPKNENEKACVNSSDLSSYINGEIKDLKSNDDFKDSSVTATLVKKKCDESSNTCSIYGNNNSYKYEFNSKKCD